MLFGDCHCDVQDKEKKKRTKRKREIIYIFIYIKYIYAAFCHCACHCDNHCDRHISTAYNKEAFRTFDRFSPYPEPWENGTFKITVAYTVTVTVYVTVNITRAVTVTYTPGVQSLRELSETFIHFPEAFSCLLWILYVSDALFCAKQRHSPPIRLFGLSAKNAYVPQRASECLILPFPSRAIIRSKKSFSCEIEILHNCNLTDLCKSAIDKFGNAVQ